MTDELNKTRVSNIVSNISINSTDSVKNTDKNQVKPTVNTTSKSELDDVINTLNSIPIISDNLRFSYAMDEHQLLVQIRDKKTDELIRQYPSEEFLTRLRYYRDNIGVLFDQKV